MSADDPGLPSTLPGATRSLPPDSFSDVDSDIGEWVRDLVPEGLGPLASPPTALTPGQRIGVHFEVRARLGEGGMGVVYLARDDRLDREVAIKLVGRRSDRATARLAREAQAMAQLSHPNVLVVHEVGEHAGSVYIAMEFVDGPTLRAWQEQRTRTWQALLEVYLQAARGLAAAHAAGLVHRDFKPDNVLVGRDGRVRVADFGLARAHHDTVSSADISSDTSSSRPRRPELAVLTRTDAVLGTPAYMAPEQHGRGSVTPAVDQFAFGVALHEALWGRRPFGDLPNWLASDADLVTPTDLRGTPRWLRRLVRRMLAIDPRARLPAMDAVVATIERGLRRTGRRAWVVGGVAVVGLTAAVGIGVGLTSRPDPCGDAKVRAAQVWDGQLRERVEQAFAGDGGSAHEGWLRVRGEVDAWFDGWVAARRASCEATRVHGSQSEALLDRSRACFDARIGSLQTTLEFLADNAEARGRLARLVDDVPSFEVCSDAEYLLARVPPPADPEVRRTLDVLGAAIDTASLEIDIGRIDDASARLEVVAREAEAIGWAPLLARLEQQRGRIDFEQGDHARAQTRLHRAYFASRAVGDDEHAAPLASMLGYLAGVMHNDRAAAEIWLDHAAADIERGAAAPELADSVATTRSQVLQRAGANDEAVAVMRTALARGREAPMESFQGTQLHIELAAALDASGRHAEALDEYDEIIARLERIYGAGHPQLAQAYNNRGLCHYLLHRFDAAIADLQAAIAIAGNTVRGYEAAAPQLNLGLAFAAAGRLDEAIPPLERARDIYVATPDAGADEALALNALGWVELRRGRFTTAAALHREALAKQRTALPTDHPELAVTLGQLGEAERASGRLEPATASLRDAIALADRQPAVPPSVRAEYVAALARVDLEAGRTEDASAHASEVIELAATDPAVGPRDRARAEFVLAQLHALHGHADAAVAAAVRALEAYRDDATSRDDARAVERWLAAHGGP